MKKQRIMNIILVVILLSTGSGVYLRFAWDRYSSIASTEAIMLAQSLNAMIHANHIVGLHGSSEDLLNPDYIMIKTSLIRLVKTANPVHFAYLIIEKNETMVFLVDSEPPESPNYSTPGQVYEEADEIYHKTFLEGQINLSQPITDRWGTWISVLVPVFEPKTGAIIAVLGIDYSAQAWNLRLWNQMIPDIMIVISLVMLILALRRTRIQRSKLQILSSRLAHDEELFRGIFNQAPIGIAVVNDKSFIIESEFGQISMNSVFEQILGRSAQELKNIQWPEITYPQDLEDDLNLFAQFKSGETSGYIMEKRFIRPDGTLVWTNMRITGLTGELNTRALHLCLLEDITERKATAESLRESERSKLVLLANLPGMAYRCLNDAYWTMVFVSEGCCELTGYKPEELVRNKEISYNDIIDPNFREKVREEWNMVTSEKSRFEFEYQIRTKSGEPKWVLEIGEGIYNQQGEITALEGIILNITERKKAEDQLRFYSEHDIRTGLMNRRVLESELMYDALHLGTYSRALVGINLSSLHLRSLTYGFGYSQALLKKIADTLKSLCNPNTRLFNTFEYRFVFYIKNYQSQEILTEFCRVVEKIVASILDLERITGGISVVEINEFNQGDAETLLKQLLVASEKAMQNTGTDHNICFYNEEMADLLLREETISRELFEIAEGKGVYRLRLQFQPILDLKTKTICGFEALARLNTKELGPISPVEFIPITEKTKLIIPLGYEILAQALKFLKKINQDGYSDMNVTINISAIQLLKEGFLTNLISQIQQFEVCPSNIGLELTETIFVSNYDEINRILAEIKKFGLKVYIDDFGTGYSSLAREREINADFLKIDKQFIDKLMTYDEDETLSSDIISMGHKLGRKIVAEGVEHEKQFAYLQEQNCDYIQGYYISRPLDEDKVLEFLKNYR